MRTHPMPLWLAVAALCIVAAAGTARAQQDPQVIRDQAADQVRRAYDALRRYDTGTAVDSLRHAVGLLAQLSSGDRMLILVSDGAGGMMPERDPALQQLAFVLEAAAMSTLGGEGEKFGPEYQRDLPAEKMKELREEAERLRAQQDRVTREIDELRKDAERQEAGEEGNGEQAAEGGEGEAAAGQGAAQGAEEAGEEAAGGQDGGEQAGANQAAAETADRQAGIAGNAARMADRIRELAGEEGGAAGEIADRFLAAAADAQTAAARVRQSDFAAAFESAERAGERLDEALASLKNMSKEEVNFLVDQVVADLERLLAEQRDIRAKTEDLAKSSAPDGKPDARALRDVKGLAPRQDALRKGMESVEFDLTVLKSWAETDARHETRQSIFAAHDAARRGRVPQKMTNAIVAYSEFDLRAASREQKAAERSMAGILERVQDAYASMASDPLSELKAAEIEARKIEENLAALTGRGGRPARARTGSRAAGGKTAGSPVARSEAARGRARTSPPPSAGALASRPRAGSAALQGASRAASSSSPRRT